MTFATACFRLKLASRTTSLSQRVNRGGVAHVRCCSGSHHTETRSGPINRRALLATTATGIIVGNEIASRPAAAESSSDQIVKSDEEWKATLTPGQYYVLRKAGTEMPNSSPLNKEKRAGTFVCAGCGTPLFLSSTKYNSGTGWPSFYDHIPGAVDEKADLSIPFMPRTEVECKRCGGHLGHVFNDGPAPTGLRYCMNGLALNFVPEQGAAA